MAIGSCSRCGKPVKSRSFQYCRACAKELGVCQMCGKPSERPLCNDCSRRPILH